MKVNLDEFDNVFFFEFFPETKDDVVKLVRFGMNATKERIFIDTYVDKDLSVLTHVSISKRKSPFSVILRK